MEHNFDGFMEDISEIIRALPQQPGVYQFLDRDNHIIYVGKAKNLRSRVASYFNKQQYDSYKTKVLSKQVSTIRHIVVDTEADALLLENNLIKTLQPKYNVLLKDDKTFPWIVIKNEPFPRVFSTRNRIKDGSEYFGPYTSAFMVKVLLNLVRQIYHLRTCNFLLNDEQITRKRYKRCLEYHIGNCKAPCEGLQSLEDYQNSIDQIRNILKGNIQEVVSHLRELMQKLAANYKFEEAEAIKQKMLLLENYRAKSTIVNPKLSDVDVFSYCEKDNRVAINFLKVVQGAVVQSHTLEVKGKLRETPEELLLVAIVDIRTTVHSTSTELLVPFLPETELPGINFSIPRIGDKRKLLELSERNARHYLAQKEKMVDNRAFEKRKNDQLTQVKTDLKLKAIPAYMECFDNSNIQGAHPVAACVVFRNGKPSKKDYRHFNIKTVEGPNDFASMEEVIYRRYKRLIDEQQPLPDLVVIDGGKGQLSSAVKSLSKLKLLDKIPVIGIAKRLEEIYYPGDSVPLYIDKNSYTLKLLQYIRNEAHRFGISFHRDKRSVTMLKSSLEGIPGVGPATLEKLLRRFGSVERIVEQEEGVLAEIVGPKLAKQIIEHYAQR